MKIILGLKKNLLWGLLFVSSLVFFANSSLSQAATGTSASVVEVPCPEGTTKNQAGLCLPESSAGGIAGSQNLGQLLTKILELLLYVVGALAVVFIVIGGYQYITSHGNEEQAEKGKKTLVNSIIGLTLVILAYMIVRVIANALTKDIVA